MAMYLNKLLYNHFLFFPVRIHTCALLIIAKYDFHRVTSCQYHTNINQRLTVPDQQLHWYQNINISFPGEYFVRIVMTLK